MRWILALLLSGLAPALQAGVPTGSIDDFIDAEMPAAGAPGLAYAVFDEGEIRAGERGEILLGSGREIRRDTPFVIGSISKSFTALAVMQLMERGEVDLDSGISDYLESFRESPASSVTIRQLLSHTSGYSTVQGNNELVDSSAGTDALSRQARRIAQWTPAYEPNTRFAYSNANYYVLGALIEVISGKDFASYIKAEILDPLGMEHSFVADGERHDNIAVGHPAWFGTKRPVKDRTTHRMSAPAGGIIASATDLVQYLAVMMNGKDDILSARGKSEMMRPASEVSPFYGFGWAIDPADNTVYHTGLTPGVETLAIMMPDKQKAAVLFVNAGSGMGLGESLELFNGFSARALALDYASPGNGGRWSRMAFFLTFVLLPAVFLISMTVAWLRRSELRAKSGPFGVFSIWFPLLMTLALAWASVFLIPRLFGVSLETLGRFSPDLALALAATAVSGVVWAVFRLGVFYAGTPASE